MVSTFDSGARGPGSNLAGSLCGTDSKTHPTLTVLIGYSLGKGGRGGEVTSSSNPVLGELSSTRNWTYLRILVAYSSNRNIGLNFELDVSGTLYRKAVPTPGQ